MPVFIEDEKSLPPQEVFSKCCEKRGVAKPNKSILTALKRYSKVKDVEEINIKDTYVGAKQLLALADFVEQCECLDTLALPECFCYHTDLSSQWNGSSTAPTGNEAWSRVVEAVRRHPSLTSLDISYNDCGPLVGRLLYDAVKQNTHILELHHDHVMVDEATLQMIDKQVEENVKRYWDEQQGDEPEEEPQGHFGSVDGGFTFGGPPEDESDEGDADGGEDNDPFSDFGTGPKKESVEYNADKAVAQIRLHRKSVRHAAFQQEKGRRVSRSCASYNPKDLEDFTPPEHEKTKEELDGLGKLLKRNLLFAHLRPEDLAVVQRAMFRKQFSRGHVIMNQGDEGDNMYTISKGSVDIYVNGDLKATRGVGVSFGELALMYDTPRTATVVAAEDVEMWGIDRDTYRNIVMGASVRKRQEYQEVLQRIDFLKGLNNYELLQLSDALETTEWNSGDYILRYGESGEHMYIIISGRAEVIGRDAGKKIHVCFFGAGDHFGELEFLNKHTTVADVVAREPTRTVRLKRSHFELCMGPIIDLLRRNADTDNYKYYRGASKLIDPGEKDEE
eukprot:Sspe_Gene.83397::Locus_54705_Transcript_1_1_Confidence_1.000_Length_1759::g.83397::m.83397/K04739/PRKAR; cAMP-dependent protein kinase regulator